MIDARQETILFAAISEYIKNARPVSSNSISGSSRFDVSSATLRNELAYLEKEGFLFQPHTSSGRVPTDKGYRFFVDWLLKEAEANATREKRFVEAFCELAKLREKEYAIFSELAKTFAELSGNTVFSGILGSGALFKAGIHEVLRQPELEDLPLRRHFGDIVDSLEEDLEEISEFIEGERPVVFIGRENPISKARDFSMIVSKHKIFKGDNEEGIIVIFGPKRMNYRKNLRLLQSLIDWTD